MMYRRQLALTPKMGSLQQMLAGRSLIEMAAGKALELLVVVGLYEQARRENRRRDRWAKRSLWFRRAAATGLNGKRAVARRRLQIERGQLTVANGLAA